jgi:hypothetical protein
MSTETLRTKQHILFKTKKKKEKKEETKNTFQGCVTIVNGTSMQGFGIIMSSNNRANRQHILIKNTFHRQCNHRKVPMHTGFGISSQSTVCH